MQLMKIPESSLLYAIFSNLLAKHKVDTTFKARKETSSAYKVFLRLHNTRHHSFPHVFPYFKNTSLPDVIDHNMMNLSLRSAQHTILSLFFLQIQFRQ